MATATAGRLPDAWFEGDIPASHVPERIFTSKTWVSRFHGITMLFLEQIHCCESSRIVRHAALQQATRRIAVAIL
ncbi:MAG: hypothetical protein LBE06_00400 [Azoarcus sp.]|jgi:hypothetical protein|nr:hypothetical protein [Azoarcus sp.]